MTDATAGGSARHKAPLQLPLLPLVIALAGLAFVASIMAGPAGFGLPANVEAARMVLIEIRLPRALLGALVGGALGLSGAVLQGYLRNALAEPSLLGISGGASLGAVISIHTGAVSASALALPLGGMVGAAAAALAVLMLAGQRTGALTLILAGVAISSIAGALTTLALTLSSNPFASVEMLFWLLGALDDRSFLHVWLAAPLIAAGVAMLLSTGTALNALTLGDDAAQNLGVDLQSLRNRIILGTVLTVGAATAVAGTIGFVGLVVPHVLRRYVGFEPRRLLPASLFGGAALVLSADAILHTLAPLRDIRLGVATSLVGAPFFLRLVIKSRSEVAQ